MFLVAARVKGAWRATYARLLRLRSVQTAQFLLP